MLHLVWTRLRARKFVSLTIILAFISAYLLIPIGLYYAKETRLAVEQSIVEHGRGNYDLLIRPASARSTIEQTLGGVEENYIGDSQGGISIEEWQQIKQHPDVEVAAPVASIGYFTGEKFTIQIPELDVSSRFTFEFETSDGLKSYPIAPPSQLIYFNESSPGFIQYLKKMTPESDAGSFSGAMDIFIPNTFHLLTGIDMKSEEQLTNIDFSDFNNEIPPLVVKASEQLFPEAPLIKVLQREDLRIPLQLKVTVDTLDINIEEYREKLGLDTTAWLMTAERSIIEQVLAEIEQLPAQQSTSYDIDLTPFYKPFNSAGLNLTKEFELDDTPLSVAADRNYIAVHYLAKKLDYQVKDENLHVQMVENGSPPSYKEIERKGKPLVGLEQPPFLLQQVGTFAPNNEQESALTSSPLGIYGTTETKTTTGETLTPTTIPGSFIAQPTGGIISLQDAEIIKGPTPIDAIRVRLAGISSYTQEAQQKIEALALEFLQQGYTIDIVAGSSFKEVKLQVEGIGEVISPWTTLGVAQQLEEQWNSITLWTTILFTMFIVAWFIARLSFEKSSMVYEDTLLATIGWTRQKIFQRNTTEQSLLLTMAYLLSIVIIFFLGFTSQAYIITTIIFIIALSLVYIFFSISKESKTRTTTYPFLQAVVYHRQLIIPTMLILVISTILFVIQIATISDAIRHSVETTLGQFTVNTLLLFQIFILVATLVLTIFSLFECLSTLFYARAQEFDMYYRIGWTKTMISLHVVKEVFLWTGFSIGLGLIISYMILFQLKVASYWIFIEMLCAVVILGIVIFLMLAVRQLLKAKRD
ncbi:ABC transporter permease [Bacillus ndiopicus]|uniref:ABC transporter permease n=1 Tax=Bacillus ndiopicus TaxID=1347368 RepID=UPI0005A98571|nr:ABC transporter permease [Bacillus ndiopicus]